MTGGFSGFDLPTPDQTTLFERLWTLLVTRDVFPAREHSVGDRFGAWTQIV